MPGATVESWTEETDLRFGGFERIGLAVSDGAGRFRLAVERDGYPGEKIRVTKPGYLAFLYPYVRSGAE